MVGGIRREFAVTVYMYQCSALNEDETENDDDISEQEVPQDTGVTEKSLWVDKYSPRSYVELLSDDVSNQEHIAG